MSETTATAPAADSPSLVITPGKDFPLPPKHLIDQLDNQAHTVDQPASTKGTDAEVATLDYVDGPPEVAVQLEHKFRLGDRVVETITVSALTVQAVGEVIRRVGTAKLDPYDFYAEMTDLPAPVIRALVGEDGDRVTQAGWSFLPRFVKTALGG